MKTEERRKQYERKVVALEKNCETCRKTQNPTIDRCNYHCSIGRKLRMLEAEYSDVTGWSHNHWKEEN